MNIIIPIHSPEKKEITSLKNKHYWVMVSLDKGNIVEKKFFQTYEEITEFIEYLIVKSKNEDVDDFLDEGIDILVAPFQNDIDDIIEAFIFRELYNYNE